MKITVLCPRCRSGKTKQTMNKDWSCHNCGQLWKSLGRERIPSEDFRPEYKRKFEIPNAGCLYG